MEYKDILVLLDDASCAARLDVAFQAAARFDASVSGVCTMLLPDIPTYVETQLPEAVKKSYDEAVRVAVGGIESYFHERSKEATAETSSHTAVGHFEEVIQQVTRHARFADITVLCQSQGERREGFLGASIAEQMVLSSGGPVLISPRSPHELEFGNRIMVGWNGSREAGRALHDAIPFLKLAEEVTLLSVEPAGAKPPPANRWSDITRHLSHHGIEASVRQSHVDESDVGGVILSRAEETGADMIVMGAYGRSRLRELALGGTTRHIMTHATVPVLMSH